MRETSAKVYIASPTKKCEVSTTDITKAKKNWNYFLI